MMTALTTLAAMAIKVCSCFAVIWVRAVLRSLLTGRVVKIVLTEGKRAKISLWHNG